MGIYFIAAGTGLSKNRFKTLDRGWELEQISGYTEPKDSDRLHEAFRDGSPVYLWGANKGSRGQLKQVRTGEYVVDVKNTEVVHVFRFCFWAKTADTKLQAFVGWDAETPKEKWRPYRWVFFLRDRVKTTRTTKAFFKGAFGERNPQWLAGQKYFDDVAVQAALAHTSCRTVEKLLGIQRSVHRRSFESFAATTAAVLSEEPADSIVVPTSPIKDAPIDAPDWLEPVLRQVEALRADSKHLERDHEDLVASLFERLGYQRIKDIKFQRGLIDIRIDSDGKPLIIIEVKKDWALSPRSSEVLQQAYNYARTVGTRYVVITNGDIYGFYDATKGLTYDENMVGEFRLTELTSSGIDCLEKLRKNNLGELN